MIDLYPLTPYQVVILAGGKGTRLSEETQTVPKPMVKVGDKTLLEHIIDIYDAQGLHEFLIPVGYKSQVIFNYFGSRFDKTYGHVDGVWSGQIGRNHLTIIQTGEDTQTGGRLLRLQPYINAPFFMTYGDGLANVNMDNLRETHDSFDAMVTLTAVHPIPRFGALTINPSGEVTEFGEKIDYLDGWINGGFMLMSPSIFNIIDDDYTNLESEVLPYLASSHDLYAYRHESFWHCVDTLRDLQFIRNLEQEGMKEWMNIFG